MHKLTILESPYIFAIATCGVPYWGRPFVDAAKILQEKNQQLQAAWYVRLVSNYIPWRDIAADWQIAVRAWLAERKLKKIASAIGNREQHETWQLLRKFCAGIMISGRQDSRKLQKIFSAIRKCVRPAGFASVFAPKEISCALRDSLFGSRIDSRDVRPDRGIFCLIL